MNINSIDNTNFQARIKINKNNIQGIIEGATVGTSMTSCAATSSGSALDSFVHANLNTVPESVMNFARQSSLRNTFHMLMSTFMEHAPQAKASTQAGSSSLFPMGSSLISGGAIKHEFNNLKNNIPT